MFSKFREVFKLFANCHSIYDSNYVSDDQITELGRCISTSTLAHTLMSFSHR